MVIDYATGWPVAKIVKDIKAEIIANFLVLEIFRYYKLLKKLLSDNSNNLLANVLEYYLQKFYTWYNYIITYYPQINKMFENLNGTLSDMLTKYLVGKFIKLWDK